MTTEAAATAGAITTAKQMSNYIAYNTNKNNCSTYYYYPPDDDDDDGESDCAVGATNMLNDNFYDEELYANEYSKLLHPAAATSTTTTTTIKTKAEKYISKDDSLLLEHATRTTNLPLGNLPKSNSYDSATALKYSNAQTAQHKSKNTILKQDSLNGHVATSLNESESDSEYAIMLFNNNCNDSLNKREYAAIDFNSVATNYTTTATTTTITHSYANNGSMLNGNTALIISNTSANSSSASSRRNTRILARTRTTCCYRLHAFLTRNWYLSYLVPLSILLALMFVAYLTRDYAKRLLYWIEAQNSWVTFALFMLFFILVSFPIVVGYFVLMITAGYLFGCIKGFLTVVLGANLGIAIAHLTIRSLRHRIPMQKLIKNETGRAILRVISGPRAFKVVLFTRLTPLPFGLQNAIFGVSSINPRIYHSATFLGLLPAQAINVYLGSTLRSMHEVLNNHGTALTGYISFVIEVICGVGLMFWVVQKARKELSETLISDISNEGKLIDIQV